MKASDVISLARSRLGDQKKTGWSDDELLSYLNLGLNDICSFASLYRKEAYITLNENVSRYSLPLDVYKVDRLEYLNKPIAVLSREDNDIRPTRGCYVSKSNLNIGVLDIFNVPLKTVSKPFFKGTSLIGIISVSSLVGVVTKAEDIAININNSNGMPTYIKDIIGSEQTVYGFLVGDGDKYVVEKPNYGFTNSIDLVDVKGVYGICTDVLTTDSYVKVFYTATPRKLNSLEDALNVHSTWKRSLLHFVVGMARESDVDESNYILGEKEMVKYTIERDKAKREASRNYSSVVHRAKKFNYRGVFDG